MSDAPEAATPCGSVRVWDDGRSTICIRPAGHLGYHTTRDRERPKWDDMEWWDRPLPLATPGGHDVSTHPATTGDNADA